MLLLNLLIVSALPSAPAASHSKHYEKLARAYFRAWNDHDSASLSTLLAESASLRDWNVEKQGRQAVVDANVDIWKAVPKIAIDIHEIHVAERAKLYTVVTCEIMVKLNNSKDAALKVADVITFDEHDRILSVRAYKG